MKWGPVTLELSVGFRAIGVPRTELAEHGHCDQLLVGSPVNGGDECRNPGFGVLNLDHVQAAILFSTTGGEFAFGCVTGTIHGSCVGDAVEFNWQGNDEMDHASGHGWADLQDDGTLEGEICFHNGDEATFIARPWNTSSTTC